MRIATVLALLLCSSVVTSQNKVLHVPSQYKTIQAAIDSAKATDTVLVDPGIYRETIDLKGKAITVKSSGGASATTIDAEKKGSVIQFHTGEDPKTRLEGFTLINGSGTVKASKIFGGAIYCMNASPQHANLIIMSNSADQGGGLYAMGGSPVITSCSFQGNSAPLGGGGMYLQCTCRILDSDLIGNKATNGNGGGIYSVG